MLFNEFQRGAYNEIIPPPFYFGISPNDAVDQLASAVLKTTGNTLYRPKKGKSKAGLERLAALYVHQQKFIQALSGTTSDPTGLAIRVLVEDAGESLSLRPLFLDDIHHLTFVPVLTKIDKSWQIGVLGKGKHAEIKAGSLAEAYVKAQAIYNKWSEVESQKWQSEMKTAVKKLMPDMSALVWEIQLRRHNKVDVGGSFRLERWGGHGQYALWLPSKTYFPYTASNLHQASMFLRAMINQQKLPLTDPPLQIVEKHLKSVLPTVSRGQGRTYLTGEMLVSVTNQRIEVFNRHKPDKKIGYVQLRRGVGEAYKNNRRMDKFKLVRRLAFPEGWKSQTRLDIAILWAFYLWL